MKLHYYSRKPKSSDWLEVIRLDFDLRDDDPRTTDAGIPLAMFKETAPALDFAVSLGTGQRPPHNLYYGDDGEPAVALTDAEPEFPAGGQLHVTISADLSRVSRPPAAVIVRPCPKP